MTPPFVVASELSVEAAGAAALEAAFNDRLGEVEGHPGFRHLEVWRDNGHAGSYLMVTWWDDEESFLTYMRSQEHARSHARVPRDPVKARGVGLRRFSLIAT